MSIVDKKCWIKSGKIERIWKQNKRLCFRFDNHLLQRKKETKTHWFSMKTKNSLEKDYFRRLIQGIQAMVENSTHSAYGFGLDFVHDVSSFPLAFFSQHIRFQYHRVVWRGGANLALHSVHSNRAWCWICAYLVPQCHCHQKLFECDWGARFNIFPFQLQKRRALKCSMRLKFGKKCQTIFFLLASKRLYRNHSTKHASYF